MRYSRKPARSRQIPPEGFQAPCLATAAAVAPDGDNWINEIKFDGYRLLAFKEGGRVRLWSRHGLDWTAEFEAIARSVAALPCDRILLDGEAVVLREDGLCDRAALAGGLGRSTVTMVAFDLLSHDRGDTRPLPLRERRKLIAAVLPEPMQALMRIDGIVGNGPRVFEEAIRLGQEGIVSKRLDAPYRSGRSTTWLKIKDPHYPA